MPTTFLTPQLRIEVNGVARRSLSGQTSCGFRASVATASVAFAAGESAAQPGDRVTIWLGYVERGGQLVFVGEADDDTLDYWPEQPGVQCSGYLGRMQRGIGAPSATAEPDPETGEVPAYEATGITDKDIVEALCALYGCPVGDIAGMDPPTTFGDVFPVQLAKDAPGWSLVEELDRLTFMRTFDAPDGTVRRLPVNGIPSAAALTLTEGVNLLEGQRSRSRRGVINRVTMTGTQNVAGPGLTPKAERFAPSPYIPTPPQYQSEAWSSELAETEELCDWYCANRLGQTNRLSEQVGVRVERCRPDIYPGMSLAISSAHFQYGSDYVFWVEQVEHSWDANGIKTNLGLIAATGEEGLNPNQPPVPIIDLSLERETLDDGTNVWIVYADGSASYDPDGVAIDTDPQHGIATYLWDGDPNGPVTPAGLPRATYIYFADPTGATITLTVRDTSLKSATISVLLNDVMVRRSNRRDLWAAVEADLLLTIDGGVSWQSVGVPAVVIAEQAHPEYQLAAEASGALHRVTLDAAGAFAVEDVGPPNNVTALNINLGVDGKGTHRCWAGCADGATWLSTDDGQTWVPRGTIAVPDGSASTAVRHIEEAGDAFGTLWAIAGPAMFLSFDEGVTWASQRAYPDPALTATRFASGRFADVGTDTAYHWMCLAGTSDNDKSRVIEANDFDAVDFPAAAKPAQPSGMTIGVYAPELLLVDQAGGGKSWYLDDFSGGGNLVQRFYDTIWGLPQHIIRDGRYDGIVYGAAIDNLFKTWDKFVSARNLLSLYSPQVGRMIAYGALRAPLPLKGDLVWCATAAGTTVVRWIYRLTARGFQRAPHPLNGVSAEFNQLVNLSLLVGESGTMITYGYMINPGRVAAFAQAAFRSTDGGVTWTPIAGIDNCYAVAAGPGGVWYAARSTVLGNMNTGHELLRSDDDGVSWTYTHGIGPSSSSVPGFYASLSVDPTDNQRVLIKSYWYGTSQYFLSHDGGVGFDSLGPDALPQDQAGETTGPWAEITPDGQRVVWYRYDTVDRPPEYAPLTIGTSVKAFGSGPSQGHSYPTYRAGGDLYMATQLGVLKSEDNGSSWTVYLDNTTFPALGGGSYVLSFVPGDGVNAEYALPLIAGSSVRLMQRQPGGDWTDLTPQLVTAFPDGANLPTADGAVRLPFGTEG